MDLRKKYWPFLLLLGVCLGLFVHLFVVRQQQRRENGKLPLFASRDQRIYLSATHGQPDTTLMDQRKTLASGSVFHGYNVGTYLASQSVVSGEVKDISMLQQAEQYLSGAVADDTTKNKELLHNLETVRSLLNQNAQQSSSSQGSSTSGENTQGQTSSGGSGAQQSMNAQTSSGSQDVPEAQQRSNETPLSEATKKQLENYQQQLEKEQAQNQDFFNKQITPQSMSDPFSIFSQFFGQDPLLDQHIGTSGTKDW